MWLILTEPYDETGPWLAAGLRDYTPAPVAHLTTRDIMQRARTAHVLENGIGWFQLTVENGVTVDSRSLQGVVNRVCALPPGLACRLDSHQRENAQRNFGLPLLRLLHGFKGPVLNRPTAQGISGDFRLDFEWAALASQVGLPRASGRPMWPRPQTVGEMRATATATCDVVPVAVIGDHVLALDDAETRLPSGVIANCRRLAALSRSSLLGLELLRSPDDEWEFLRANPRMSLIPGGNDALAAVARALTVTPAREAVPRFHFGRSLPFLARATA